MKKITKAEEGKMIFKSRGNNPVINYLRTLAVSESLFFTRKEWKPKSLPAIIVPGAFRDGKKFSTRILADGSGWVATRIK